MWTRRELKERAKEALRRNYWKIVLVSSLMLLLGGGVGATGIGGDTGSEAALRDAENTHENDYDTGKKHNIVKTDLTQEETGARVGEEEVHVSFAGITAAAISVAVFLVIFVLVFLMILAVDVFVLNPFSVGVDRFMLKSMEDRAEVKEVAHGFDHFYQNIVRTLFHRDLQIFLWALLFIIPGIYKKYQYRMVSYIMAEHPDTEYRSALQMSKEMMNGHKWRAFVLDLSFILWHFLGTITCGIAEVFYVQPYQQLTCAALYRRISGSDSGRIVYDRNEDCYGI